MYIYENEWKSYKISDLFLLETENNISDSQSLIDGDYPIVSAKKNKNGVDRFVCTEKLNDKHAITWNKQGDGGAGLSFYQPTIFANKSTVFVLRPKIELNKYHMLFIVSLLNKYHGIFNHGYGLTQARFYELTIELPSSNDKNPDWDFIEQYMQQLESKKLKEYEEKLIEKLNKLNFKRIEPLDEKDWEEFSISGEIFEKIQRGKRLTKKNFIDGNMPYISSTSFNNGISAFVGNTKKVRIYEDCLTLANSGSVGSTFYHPYSFVASDHVTHLKNHLFNRHIYLFIATMVKRLGEKYNFNREINDERIERETIILPITDRGNPDYEYMEQYMINLEIEQLTKYLNYIKHQ